MKIIISILVIVFVIIVLAILRVYNQLILLQNNKDNALADMASSLDRLMTKLSDSGTKKATHAWEKANTPVEKIKAFNLLESSLEEIATSKAGAYLEKTAGPRRYYNHTTKKLNALLVVFPTNIVANFLDYEHEPLFILTQEEKNGETLDIKR